MKRVITANRKYHITSAIINRYKGYDIGIDETSTDNAGLYYATKGNDTYYADTEEELYDLIDEICK